MSVKLELLAQEWHQAVAQIKGHENALADHLKSDWMQVKERYEASIEHFKERLAFIESKLPDGILKQLKGGQSAKSAVQLHLNPPVTAEVDVAAEAQ